MQKIRYYFKKYRIIKALFHFLSHIGTIYKREYLFFEIKLQGIIPNNKDKSDLDFDFIWVKKNDFDHYDFPDEQGWITRDEALRRLKQRNCILLALTKGNKIICYQWSDFDRAHIPRLGLLVYIPAKVAYPLAMYTRPEFRGKGLATKLKLLQLHFLKEQGYQRVFLVIRTDNLASQIVNKKCGYKAYQTVTYRKISFLKYYCVKDYATNKRKNFLYIKERDQKLWNFFSKIKDNE